MKNVLSPQAGMPANALNISPLMHGNMICCYVRKLLLLTASLHPASGIIEDRRRTSSRFPITREQSNCDREMGRVREKVPRLETETCKFRLN